MTTDKLQAPTSTRETLEMAIQQCVMVKKAHLKRATSDANAGFSKDEQSHRQQAAGAAQCVEVIRALTASLPQGEVGVPMGAWDDDAIGVMAGAALQSLPKIGYMDNATKIVKAVLRAQDDLAARPAAPKGKP